MVLNAWIISVYNLWSHAFSFVFWFRLVALTDRFLKPLSQKDITKGEWSVAYGSAYSSLQYHVYNFMNRSVYQYFEVFLTQL